jgi:hypothetical protein
MKYKCTLCNKDFGQKSHYNAHIRRKYSCNKEYMNINDDINNYNNNSLNPTQNHTNSTQNHTNSTQFHTNNQKIPNNKNQDLDDINDDNNNIFNDISDEEEKLSELTCTYCNKEFSRKDALLRHVKSYCKNKKIIDNTNNTVMMLMEQNKHFANVLDECKQQINELKEENNELKQLAVVDKVGQVSKSKGRKTSNTANINAHSISNNNAHNMTNANSISNNIANNNNTINNIANNYIVNKTVNFGSEDLSIISEDEILASLKTLTGVFSSFITTVHANEKYPAYSNLKILNKRSNYGFMMEEGKFVTKTFAQITDELINTRLPELEQYARDYRDQKKINLREYNTIKKTLDFLKNTYIETEDVDGNIIKGDKNDVKKLKNELGNVINAMYDNKKTILSNIDKCAKNNDNKQIKLIMDV